jgi:C-terminal processing protease CtpA/Prc
MIMRLSTAFIVALLHDGVAAQSQEMSTPAREYLTKALDLIQQNGLYRGRVDWEDVRARAFVEATRAQTAAETYGGIRLALAALGDRHSNFQTPDSVVTMNQRAAAGSSPPSGSMIDGRLAYVLVPHFLSSERSVIAGYATTLQNVVRSLDSSTTCGWVIDLRQNDGGNMWPMLAGLGPLLSEGAIGSFTDGNGSSATWFYENGAARLGRNELVRITEAPYRLRKPNPSIAVLTSARTTSSGEAVAIAFRGNPNTRSFGQRTQGLSTANGTFKLSDGAVIVLTQAIDADRSGNVYEDGVSPDVVTGASEAGVPAAARQWLLNQPACRP